MFKELFLLYLKALFYLYVFPIFLPVLCVYVSYSLLKRFFVMGQDFCKCIFDDGQHEQTRYQKNEVITKQPHKAKQKNVDRVTSQTAKHQNFSPADSRDNMPKKSSSERDQVNFHDEDNNKPKQRGRKPGGPPRNVQPVAPHSADGTKRRNQNSKNEPKPNPADRISRTADQGAKRQKLSSPTEQTNLNEKILLPFKESLQKGYQEQFGNRKPHNFCIDVRMQKSSGDVAKNLCNLAEFFSLTRPKMRMLVYGLPGFGKSQLCQDLTSVWVSQANGNSKKNSANFKMFQFWILIELDKENVMDLEATIIGNGHMFVSEVKYDAFRNAWKSEMTSTLIILDGYDNLNSDEQFLVKSFIQENAFFKEASFLLTCRPNNNAELGKLFNIHADICGLTEETLTHYIGNVSNIQSSKIKELYGVSPFFAQEIGEVLNREEKLHSLYDLLHKVMDKILHEAKLTEKEVYYLGHVLLKNLKRRKFIFELNKQPRLQDILTKCNILSVYSAEHGGKCFLVSHMIFMIYFCVRYLREQCNYRDRKSLFEKNLSFNDVPEEFFTSCELPNKTYMVGLVPEIVFDIQSELFVMTPDAEGLNCSSVFETQRILLRANHRQLEMFRIGKVEESLFQESFAELLNMLDFPDLTVGQLYFVQQESSLQFLKLLVVNNDEDEKIAMLSVASSNQAGQIQDVIVEFKDSDMKQLSSFLEKLPVLFFSPCEIDTNNSGPEFIMSLVLSALRSCHNCYTQLTFCPNGREPTSFVTWEIISNSQNKPCFSFVHTVNNNTILRKYDTKECLKLLKNENFTEFVEIMKNCASDSEEVHITVCIKTNF